MSHDALGSRGELSSFDWVHQIDRVYGPWLPYLRMAGLILAQFGDPSPFLEAKNALESALASLPAHPSPDDCLHEAYVGASSSIWRKFTAARKDYETQLALYPHAEECLWLLDGAIATRRRARQALRRAGLLCRGGAVRFPRRLHDAPTNLLLEYRAYEKIVHAGLRAWCAAYQAGKDVPTAVQHATLAMRQVWLDGWVWQSGMLMYVPRPEVQTVGMIELAGWVDSQISLEQALRLATVLEAELAIRADYSKARRDILRAHLPTNTFRAWHTEQKTTLAELRTRIAYLVEHDLSDQHAQEFHPKEPLQAAAQHHCDNPTYEEVARKLEEEDLYAAHFRLAQLTAYEEVVTRLQLQDYSDQEIADTLGKKPNAIQQAWRAAKDKLKQVMSS